MSNYGPQPGHPEIGDFEHVCKGCGVTFYTDNPRQMYHNRACKRQAQNKRHYKRHSKKIIRRMTRNQRLKVAMHKSDQVTQRGQHDPAA